MSAEAPHDREPGEAAQRLVVTLNPGGISNTILGSVSDVLTVIGICVPAIQEADLTKPNEERKLERAMATPPGDRIPGSFELKDARTVEDRRAACLNWMLSRGFQELARAVRNALEQAHLYLTAIKFFGAGKESKLGDFQAAMAPAYRNARKLNFPSLLEVVNKSLSQPLHFEKEFLSFQRVRNCLEHRAGIVTPADVDGSGALVLSLPRLVIFYMKDGQEIEVRTGEIIEGEDGKGTRIHLRMGTGSREFKLGVLFNAREFEQIGLGCWAFANDLSQKLPRPTVDSTAEPPKS